VGVEADDALDLLLDAVRIGRGEVDLVDHRHNGEVVVDREIGVGERLRLDALRGVDDQERSFAGGKAARDLVGEIDVAGGVDEVELVRLAVVGLVEETDGAGLDGDAALALEVHVVEDLVHHLALGEGVGAFEDAVGQGRLAVVDVGDDGEVADALGRSHAGVSLPPVAAIIRGAEGVMARFLWVCLGGALGTGARFLLTGWLAGAWGPGFPVGTLAVNVIGSFLLGLIMQVSFTTTFIPPTWRLFLSTGIMGGFTTYSSFNYETLKFFQDSAWGLGVLNLALTVFSCLGSGLLGLYAGRVLFGP